MAGNHLSGNHVTGLLDAFASAALDLAPGGVPTSELVRHAQEALLLVAALSLPVLAVAAVVGLIVAALQAASQIQDPTVAHLPRLLAVLCALALLGPWIAHQIGAFAERMFVLAAQ